MTQGIYGVVTDGIEQRTDCLVIGQDVPRVHGGDGVPVYLVTDHPDGMSIICHDGTERKLIAYPSDWPAPGEYNGQDWLYAKHERLPWDALIPLFDVE